MFLTSSKNSYFFLFLLSEKVEYINKLQVFPLASLLYENVYLWFLLFRIDAKKKVIFPLLSYFWNVFTRAVTFLYSLYQKVFHAHLHYVYCISYLLCSMFIYIWFTIYFSISYTFICHKEIVIFFGLLYSISMNFFSELCSKINDGSMILLSPFKIWKNNKSALFRQI